MDTSALTLPRHAWADHPHYPDQVLLLGSHRSFRQFSRMLIDRTESGGEPKAIGYAFSYWKSSMGNHEHYEEHKLYPYLEARWGISCDDLREGHHALAAVEEAVHAAVTEDSRDGLLTALREHDTVLSAHLDREEEVVIPALLALTPEEFDTYYHSSIHRLLRDLRG